MIMSWNVDHAWSTVIMRQLMIHLMITVRCVLRVACCALRIACCALRVAYCALRVVKCLALPLRYVTESLDCQGGSWAPHDRSWSMIQNGSWVGSWSLMILHDPLMILTILMIMETSGQDRCPICRKDIFGQEMMVNNWTRICELLLGS